MQNHKRYILLTILLMIGSAFITFKLKKTNITTSYPPVHTLQSTNNLLCEEQITNGVGAKDACDGKNTYGYIRAGKEMLSEAMRIGQTDKIISKQAFDRKKIKYRAENGIVYIKDVNLIKEIEDQKTEKQFKITNEDEEYIIAQSFDKNSSVTSSQTLFLDKSKGLLILNDISTGISPPPFCNDSFGSHSILYSCQEN